MELGLKAVPAGQVKMPCVTGSLRMFVDGKLEKHASNPPEYFCFDPATLAVRMTSTKDSITTGYNQIVKTQGRYLARQVDVSMGNQKLFSITVVAIDALNPSDPALMPTADAAVVQNAVNPTYACVSDDEAGGSLVHKVQPVYPVVAKADREQGEVILGAEVDKDGSIHDLDVLFTPSPMLADAAVSAVKQWRYRPCLLNGNAVGVNMIVDVFFKLGY